MSTVTKISESDLARFTADRPMIQTETIEYLQPKPMYEVLKRLFDIAASMLALIVLAIPMLILAVLIRADSSGPAIYRQTRLGLNGKPFTIFKYRTMYKNAEDDGIQWAVKDDERTTRIGRFLRATRMDELPQVWNILRGDMSIVGPRPERPEFYDLFDTYIDGFRQRMLVTPGLTGLAQVSGGYELLPEEKIVYDLEYIKHRSVKLDAQCILKTIGVVLGHQGAR